MTSFSPQKPAGSPRPRTALVVSADPTVRSDWARYFEALGMRTLRCVGPQVLCVLLDGTRCPLHEEADMAVYERASLTPELALKLVHASHSLPIAFANDQLDLNGRHEPLITATASEGAVHSQGAVICGACQDESPRRPGASVERWREGQPEGQLSV